MKILFVCTGNTCRSVMAEYIFKEKVKEKLGENNVFYIDSAGLMAEDEYISKNAKKTLEKFYGNKFDPPRKSKVFDLTYMDQFDLILTVTKNHKDYILYALNKEVENLFTISEFIGEEGEVEDPFLGSMEIYGQVFEKLDFLLDKLLNKLLNNNKVTGGNMERVFEVKHSLINHKLAIIRDKNTKVSQFRELCSDIAILLGYEVLKNFPTYETSIDTPITSTKVNKIEEEDIAFVVILRAGLGMLDGLLKMVPGAKIGHIGLYRNEETLQAVEYFCKLPKEIENKKVMLLDPMIATGGSVVDSINLLKKSGVKDINVLSLIASPEGINRIQSSFDDVNIYVAAIDEKLNEHGYIVPGLGDAGDRIFGTE